MPGNAIDFYDQIINWFNKNTHLLNIKTEFSVKLKFISTSTIKSLNDIFRLLEKISHTENKEIQINWYYDEDDVGMKDTGEEYQHVIKLPFEFRTL